MQLSGAFLAILSAASFGLNDATVRRGVLTGSTLQGLSITIPLGAILFAIAALLVGGIGLLTEFSAPSVLLLACGGISHFVWGRYWNYQAIRAIGNNLAGPVQQAGLIISLGGAVWFLGEVFTPLRLAGIVLVFLGSAVMVRSIRGKRLGASSSADAAATSLTPAITAGGEKPEFQPKYLLGYTSSVLSILGFGSSSVFIRAGLQGTTPSAGLAGGIIAYTAATLFIGLVLLRPTQRQHVFTMTGRTFRWFTLSGFLVWLAQMFRFMALAIAPVSLVAPLMQTMTIFRVIFGWFINRAYEDFSAGVLIGIFISLLGALALTISVDFIAVTVPLPDQILAIASWEWP